MKQKTGNYSKAIQAGRDVIEKPTFNVGMSVSEVQQLIDLNWNANFYKLESVAKNIAHDLAFEFREYFLSKLQKEYSEGLNQAKDPLFATAIYEAQKDYALSGGDDDLAVILMDLLVELSKNPNRNSFQLVINEAKKTAHKLTNEHLAALALSLYIFGIEFYTINNQEKLGLQFDEFILPIVSQLSTNRACYQHLVYCGCCYFQPIGQSLETALLNKYTGLFLNGHDLEDIKKTLPEVDLDAHNLLIKCFNNSDRVQLNALNIRHLKSFIDKSTIDKSYHDQIINLFRSSQMKDNEIRDKCIEIRPFMEEVYKIWTTSSLSTMGLTSVGMALGFAHLKKYVKQLPNLRDYFKDHKSEI